MKLRADTRIFLKYTHILNNTRVLIRTLVMKNITIK